MFKAIDRARKMEAKRVGMDERAESKGLERMIEGDVQRSHLCSANSLCHNNICRTIKRNNVCVCVGGSQK